MILSPDALILRKNAFGIWTLTYFELILNVEKIYTYKSKNFYEVPIKQKLKFFKRYGYFPTIP